MTMINRDHITDEMILWAGLNGATIKRGTCGFGRQCAGLTVGDNWVNWRLYDDDYQVSDSFCADDVPRDAYHKHDCVAVLLKSDGDEGWDEAWRQLGGWLQAIMDAEGAVLSKPSGAEGLQVLFSGTTTYYLGHRDDV